MVLIMRASHLWLAKYLMLINSLILSMNPVRKVDVKSPVLFFFLPRAVNLKRRFAQAARAHPWQILGSDPKMMWCTDQHLAADSFFSVCNSRMALHSTATYQKPSLGTFNRKQWLKRKLSEQLIYVWLEGEQMLVTSRHDA